MNKTIVLTGSVGSLKAACIMAGTFYAAKEKGYNIVSMVGASGSSIAVPILSMNTPKETFVELLSSINVKRVKDYDFVQQGVDVIRAKIGMKRKGDEPFTGILRGNGLRSELLKIYRKIKCTRFEHGQIPFYVVATLLAQENENSPDAETGKEVIFSTGDIMGPIRASTSIPIVFRPEFIKGVGTLADAGIVDAVPIWPAVYKMKKNCDVVIADATNDIFENRIYSRDLDTIIDIAIAGCRATVRDSSIIRMERAVETLAKFGASLQHIKPDNVKIKMFEVEKVAEATENAYQYALKTLL